MTIVIIMFVVVIAMAYSLFKPKKSRQKSYKVACAAYPDWQTAERIDAPDISNKKFRVNGTLYCVNKYETFIVDGNSMTPWSINSGDALMVTPKDSNTNISEGDSIIYEIPIEDREAKRKAAENITLEKSSIDKDEKRFKVRRALIPIDLEKEDKTLLAELKELVTKTTKEKDIEIVERKIEEARKRVNYSPEALLSLSFKNGCVDYSVHFMKNVYGKVEFVLPNIMSHN